MAHLQNDKYSIKSQLASATNPPTTLQSSPKLHTADRIYMPEYYDYFLQTVDKEIKYEGDLLRKIKRRIEDYKSQKSGRKGAQGEVRPPSHNAFTGHTVRQSHSRNRTSGQVNMSTNDGKAYKRYVNSASTSLRQTLKMKTSSFSIDFPKKENNNRCFSREISNILLNSTTPSLKVEDEFENLAT